MKKINITLENGVTTGSISLDVILLGEHVQRLTQAVREEELHPDKDGHFEEVCRSVLLDVMDGVFRQQFLPAVSRALAYKEPQDGPLPFSALHVGRRFRWRQSPDSEVATKKSLDWYEYEDGRGFSADTNGSYGGTVYPVEEQNL